MCLQCNNAFNYGLAAILRTVRAQRLPIEAEPVAHVTPNRGNLMLAFKRATAHLQLGVGVFGQVITKQ